MAYLSIDTADNMHLAAGLHFLWQQIPDVNVIIVGYCPFDMHVQPSDFALVCISRLQKVTPAH